MVLRFLVTTRIRSPSNFSRSSVEKNIARNGIDHTILFSLYRTIERMNHFRLLDVLRYYLSREELIGVIFSFFLRSKTVKRTLKIRLYATCPYLKTSSTCVLRLERKKHFIQSAKLIGQADKISNRPSSRNKMVFSSKETNRVFEIDWVKRSDKRLR